MTALTQDRNTPRAEGDIFTHPVAASARIFIGALVVLDANGFAAPGSTATGLTALGVAWSRADNSDGADGDASVRVRRGTFRFVNDGADPVDRTHIGGPAYIVDDQTVAATDGAGTRSPAGTIRDLDAQGVWVEI